MLRRLGHWSIVCALVFSIGAHWAVLQSVAWIGMAISYAQDSTLKDALIKTFDGQHPCKLCKVVKEGKSSAKKSETPKPLDKIDLFCISETAVLRRPVFDPVSRHVPAAISSHGAAPSKPPPRQSLG